MASPSLQIKILCATPAARGGLLAWLLSLMRIAPVTPLRVVLGRLEPKSASLAGIKWRLMPLQSLCSPHHSHHKPWKQAKEQPVRLRPVTTPV